MSPITRRNLLRATALAPVAGALVACGAFTGSGVPQQVIAAVNAFAGALKNAAVNLPPAVADKVIYWVNFVQGISQQLETADFSSAVTLFNSLLKVAPGILAAFAAVGLAVPGPLGIAISLFEVMLPTLEVLLGITPTPSLVPHATMSFDEALHRLQDMAR